ncbi:MAG: hypothetical protein LIR35_00865 [Bacteroidota bacterium]|nr:hypothetical protein [Bacteroidota bacterium]
MRKILATILLLVCAAAMSAQMTVIPFRKDLKKEWKEYSKLERKDQPRKQIKKLHEIRTLALEHRLGEDLLEACLKEEYVYSRLNWKSKDSVRVALENVIESYGVPLLMYRWLKVRRNGSGKPDECWEYAKAHRKELSAGNHSLLQYEIGLSLLQTTIITSSDFEWILWSRIIEFSNTRINTDSEEYKMLSELIGDKYPSRPYLTYVVAKKAGDMSVMRDLFEQYAGDPFRFYPEHEMLVYRMSRLRSKISLTEDECRDLYNDAKAFEKAIRSTGHRYLPLLYVQDIISEFEKSSISSIRFEEDSIVVTGQNFGRETLEFKSDAATRKVHIRNEDVRFYVTDTVKVPIPDLPEGSYTVTTKKKYGYVKYEKHTLSLAVRQQGDGFAAYVADYRTGEPIPSATFVLYKRYLDGRIISQEVQLNGFTPLPAEFRKKIGKKGRFYLEARCGDRRSPLVPVSWTKEGSEQSPETLHAYIMSDRSAYKPGDTLKVKAVLFEGDLRERVNTLKEGEEVQVKILNAENETAAKLHLKTNAFGSVACEWPIPTRERNGLWVIEVTYKKKHVASSSFRVDDFVLPTYELTIDPQEKPIIPGKDSEISGKIRSYSGHPVDGIILEGKVFRYATNTLWEGPLAIDMDGSFRVPIRVNDSGRYTLTIKAVDATGETRKIDHRFQVSSSINLAVNLENKALGDFTDFFKDESRAVLTEPTGHFAWEVRNGGELVKLPVSYQLFDSQKNIVKEGSSQETLDLDLSDYPDGVYILRGAVEYNDIRSERVLYLMKWTDQSSMNAPVPSVFLSGDTEIDYGKRIQAKLAAGDGPLWAVASLVAPDGTILESRLIHLEGECGKEGSTMDLGFTYKGSYPDAVKLEVFYFKDRGSQRYSTVYHRVLHSMDLNLSFSRFVDQTMPGSPCFFTIQTEPGVEAAMSVFDKSLDSVSPNLWRAVTTPSPGFRDIWFAAKAGMVVGEKQGIRNKPIIPVGSAYGIVVDQDGEPVIGALIQVNGLDTCVIADYNGRFYLDVLPTTPLTITCFGFEDALVYASPGMVVTLQEKYEELEYVVVGYGTRGFSSRIVDASNTLRRAAFGSVHETVSIPELPEESYRSVFSEALAFEPFLYSDKDGKIDFTFKTSDKVSTYHVNVFAHDPSMRNASLQRDFVVTIPVRISVTQPRYMYDKDEYELSAVVSSVSDEPISGTLYLQAQTGDDRQPLLAADMDIPAGGTASATFSVASDYAGGKPLDLRLVFESGSFSDAVKLSIPVAQAAQTLTEAHSALAGMEAVDSLRRMFINAPGDQATVAVRTLREVTEEGLAQWSESDEPDVLSLSAKYFARMLTGRDTTGCLAPIMALRNEDGGFAWMEGMKSSPMLTATLLERFAVLRDKGFAVPDMETSVLYLDRFHFNNWWPYWFGGLSNAQYMDIRAMWASVPFDPGKIKQEEGSKYRLKSFRRFARRYLTPGRYDYAHGCILDKACRIRTLKNLTSSEAGLALGKAWGEWLLTATRFQKSIEKDIASLSQYAVRHPSGAIYYPNGVLPYKGLLSSEVYTHVLLSDLLDDEVSSGVKLWLALQNETQSWTDEPAYLIALQSILDAPDSLLDKKIVTLTSTATVPFADISAAGNGMKIDRHFYIEKDGEMAEIHQGDTLQVGDKIIAKYELWSAENRSFVRIDAFREACFLPVDQLSGPETKVHVFDGDLRVSQSLEFYREVLEDETRWWLDVCPEENTVWQESLFVTQAGTFSAPVITVESLYAPEYRANSSFQGPLSAE